MKTQCLGHVVQSELFHTISSWIRHGWEKSGKFWRNSTKCLRIWENWGLCKSYILMLLYSYVSGKRRTLLEKRLKRKCHHLLSVTLAVSSSRGTLENLWNLASRGFVLPSDREGQPGRDPHQESHSNSNRGTYGTETWGRMAGLR